MSFAAPDTKTSIAAVSITSSATKNAAVVSFLRDALAHGPVAASEIERRAVDAGLLEQVKAMGKAKTFRTARAALGVKSYQQPGQRPGGWIWSWDQAPVPPESGPDAGSEAPNRGKFPIRNVVPRPNLPIHTNFQKLSFTTRAIGSVVTKNAFEGAYTLRRGAQCSC